MFLRLFQYDHVEIQGAPTLTLFLDLHSLFFSLRSRSTQPSTIINLEQITDLNNFALILSENEI